jgi:hypothetical protein
MARSSTSARGRAIASSLTRETPRELPDQEKPKLARIRAIHAANLNVQTEIVRHKIPSEKIAYVVEASVMDALRAVGHPLTNEQGGHHGAQYGWASTGVVASIYEAPELPDPGVPVVFFRIPRLWSPSMTPDELYEATRGWWTVGEQALRAQYAFGVSKGVTRAVFAVEYWRERVAGDRDYSTDDERVGFHGQRALEMEHLLGHSVKHLRWSSGGAFTYLNCAAAPSRSSLHRGDEARLMAARERSVTT